MTNYAQHDICCKQVCVSNFSILPSNIENKQSDRLKLRITKTKFNISGLPALAQALNTLME